MQEVAWWNIPSLERTPDKYLDKLSLDQKNILEKEMSEFYGIKQDYHKDKFYLIHFNKLYQHYQQGR